MPVFLADNLPDEVSVLLEQVRYVNFLRLIAREGQTQLDASVFGHLFKFLERRAIKIILRQNSFNFPQLTSS